MKRAFSQNMHSMLFVIEPQNRFGLSSENSFKTIFTAAEVMLSLYFKLCTKTGHEWWIHFLRSQRFVMLNIWNIFNTITQSAKVELQSWSADIPWGIGLKLLFLNYWVFFIKFKVIVMRLTSQSGKFYLLDIPVH